MKNFPYQKIFAISHDAAAVAIAWIVAYLLRFNFDVPPVYVSSIWHTLPWIMLGQSAVFLQFGLYRGVWRFASIPDLKRILAAVSVAGILTAAIIPLLHLPVVVPRAVLVLNPILLLLIMGGSRFVYRAWKEHRLYGPRQLMGEPVLVLGAGEAAVALLKELDRSPEWRVVGMLDDNSEVQGRQLYGVKVMGGLDRLPELAAKMGIQQAILAMPSVGHAVRRRAIEIAEKAGLTVLTVPSFEDLVSGKVSVSQVRRLEVEDLLGRDPVHLDNAGMHQLIGGQVILVTGAGGSIGSELCRQVARFEPGLLVLFELSEFALYKLEQEFRERFPKQKIACVIGDVKNKSRISWVLQKFSPAVVFHAAAYKHVPLMEQENVSEALANNVLGTYTLAGACKESGVAKFVMVSTDKAVNPTNVMGASKRLAEMVCQGMQEPTGTRFLVVRFGNVLGSSGSVIPKFHEQIAKGGPITVTHPEITRYFMSIPEAAQLVMQAGLMGAGGEIFVLDMGEPIRIADLAQEMIRLSGLTEDDIKIVYTGLRPGEKLYEELLADGEHTLPTPHSKLRVARAKGIDEQWVRDVRNWISGMAEGKNEALIKEELKSWVEEYVGDVNGTLNHTGLPPSSLTIH